MDVARKAYQGLGLFANAKRSRMIEDEYAKRNFGQRVRAKPRPNEPCDCGSEIKYKRCCGKRAQ